MSTSPEVEFSRVSEKVRVLSLKLKRFQLLAGELSQRELTSELATLFEGIELGVPIAPHRALKVNEAATASLVEWRELLSSLRDWNMAMNRPALADSDLEMAALGLLWSRILLDEYLRRWGTRQ